MRGHLRTWLAITAVGMLTFILWDINKEVSIQEGSLDTSTTTGSLVFKQFCQFLEDPLKGSEGRVPSGFTLTGLLLTFRHGERSPVVHLKRDSKHPDCSAYFNVDRHSFDIYQSVIYSKHFKKFLKTNVNFNKFPVLPERSKCQLGQMTAEGALQLVRLGNYLRHKYAPTGFFKGVQEEDIFLVSSMYPRTFQSAIAFCSAFFYPLNQENITRIVINASKNTFFCRHNDCDCKALHFLRIEHELQRSQNFLDKTPYKLRERLNNLVDLLGVKVLEHPLEFVDALLGRYACRRLPLPCNKYGDCITYEDFKQANTEAINIVKRLTGISRLNSTARRLFVAEAYPILNDLVSMIQQIRKSKNNNQIRVYSGHDVTLWPLVFVLGLDNHTQHITYAFRIAFEVYKWNNTNSYEQALYLRAIVNGVDRTKDIGFCQPLHQGLCSAAKLEDFLKKEFFKLACADDFTELCKL